MKALCLLLALIAGNAWGAFATGTTVLLDCEDNLTDSSDQGKNATLVGSATYSTSGAWHGSKAFRSDAGSFTLPTSVLNPSGGTLELSFRTATGAVGARVLYSVAVAAGTRGLEIYNNGGTALYAYSNGAGGSNTNFATVADNKNYYIKDTWDGAGNRQIWFGEWTVAGTVTLTQLFNGTVCSLATPSAVRFADSAVGFGIDGYYDWVRFRNVYDNTATVTVDPTSGTNLQLSPYVSNSMSNWMMPKWNFK